MITILGYLAACVLMWWAGGVLIAITLSSVYRKSDGLAAMSVIGFFLIVWSVVCLVGGAVFVGIQIGAGA